MPEKTSSVCWWQQSIQEDKETAGCPGTTTRPDQPSGIEDLENVHQPNQVWSHPHYTEKSSSQHYLTHPWPPTTISEAGEVPGVILSDKLSWTPHIEMVTKKVLRRNISRCPRDVKARCYESFVCPNLEYASSAWDPYTMGNIQQLEALQRRAVRFGSGDQARSVAYLLTRSGKLLNWKPNK